MRFVVLIRHPNGWTPAHPDTIAEEEIDNLVDRLQGDGYEVTVFPEALYTSTLLVEDKDERDIY